MATYFSHAECCYATCQQMLYFKDGLAVITWPLNPCWPVQIVYQADLSRSPRYQQDACLRTCSLTAFSIAQPSTHCLMLLGPNLAKRTVQAGKYKSVVQALCFVVAFEASHDLKQPHLLHSTQQSTQQMRSQCRKSSRAISLFVHTPNSYDIMMTSRVWAHSQWGIYFPHVYSLIPRSPPQLLLLAVKNSAIMMMSLYFPHLYSLMPGSPLQLLLLTVKNSRWHHCYCTAIMMMSSCTPVTVQNVQNAL